MLKIIEVEKYCKKGQVYPPNMIIDQKTGLDMLGETAVSKCSPFASVAHYRGQSGCVFFDAEKNVLTCDNACRDGPINAQIDLTSLPAF